MQMKDVQREILENKKRHNFNTTNIEQEFCYLYGEMREAYEAYTEGWDTFGEELADVNNFLMGIAEIKGVDLATEILRKLAKDGNYFIHENLGIVMQSQTANNSEVRLMKDIQKEVVQGRIKTNIEHMFCNVYSKISEAYEAYYKGFSNFEEKLADVAILLMEIAENKGIDLGDECVKKVNKNKGRKYKRNGMGYMVHL